VSVVNRLLQLLDNRSPEKTHSQESESSVDAHTAFLWHLHMVAPINTRFTPTAPLMGTSSHISGQARESPNAVSLAPSA
jgi:hypothetical protein